MLICTIEQPPAEFHIALKLLEAFMEFGRSLFNNRYVWEPQISILSLEFLQKRSYCCLLCPDFNAVDELWLNMPCFTKPSSRNYFTCSEEKDAQMKWSSIMSFSPFNLQCRLSNPDTPYCGVLHRILGVDLENCIHINM